MNRRFLVALLVAIPLLLGSPALGAEYISGDIDNDGIVRLDDALLELRVIAGTQIIHCEISAYDRFTNCAPNQIYPCDIDGDGKCDVSDFFIILQKSRGLITF